MFSLQNYIFFLILQKNEISYRLSSYFLLFPNKLIFLYISIIFLYLCLMFFLSASTNILIYFLIPAFFGVFWYIQEQVSPSEGIVAYTYTIDSVRETEYTHIQDVAWEKKEEKKVSLPFAFSVPKKEIIYLFPYCRSFPADFSFFGGLLPFIFRKYSRIYIKVYLRIAMIRDK